MGARSVLSERSASHSEKRAKSKESRGHDRLWLLCAG
jgi:hypothetical protein